MYPQAGCQLSPGKAENKETMIHKAYGEVFMRQITLWILLNPFLKVALSNLMFIPISADWSRLKL